MSEGSKSKRKPYEARRIVPRQIYLTMEEDELLASKAKENGKSINSFVCDILFAFLSTF